MVLMEVEFVTGWEAANPDSLTKSEEVQRVETDKEENKVITIKLLKVFLLERTLIFLSL